MTRTQVTSALLVPLLWGAQFVVIKIGLEVFPPLFFVAVRFAAIAAVLIPFVGRLSRRDLVPVIAISVFTGGLNFGLTFAGLSHGAAGVSSVINQLSTPAAVMLAWPLVRDRPSSRVLVGVAAAFAGVALMVLTPGASVHLLPALLVLGSGFALATGNVLTKKWGPFDPLRLIAWVSLFTVPQTLGASLLLENGQLASLRDATPTQWLALTYTVALGGIAGFGLWFWLIGTTRVSRVAPFALLQSVYAVVAGLVFLHEPLTWPLVVGMAVCMSGVALTQTTKDHTHHPRPPSLEADPTVGLATPCSRGSTA